MKKLLWMAAAVATFFASCSENEVDSTALYGEEEFTATFADTRAELDGTAVLWNMNDELTIFTKTAHNRQYRVKELSNGNRTANFGYVTYSGTDGSKISSNYAIYPYNEQTTLNGEVITTIFNADQVYNAEKVDLGNALMVAKSSTTNLQFFNATSLLRFNVKKNIPDTFTLKSIKLTSATNKLAGEVTIDFTAGAKAVVAASGSNTVTLSGINTEITQEEQPFYIALPATNFAANDLTVTFTFDEAEKEFKLPAFDLACGTIKTMLYNINDGDDFTGTTPDGEEDFEGETPGAVPANNEIWYTTTNGAVLYFYSNYSYDFGATIVSNTYENGKGVIKFDGDVTNLYLNGVDGLETITFPASVKDGFIRYCRYLKQFVGHLASDDGRCFVVDGVVNGFAPSGLTEYTFPQGITKIGGEEINGSSTYAEVLGTTSSIMKFVIPEGVTEIGYYAFGERLNEGAQSGLIVELPSTLTTIGAWSIVAAGLEEITLPANVKTIGEYAFCGNFELTTVYCKAVTPPTDPDPDGRYNWFADDTKLTKIYVPAESVAAYKAAEGWSEYADVIVGYNF